MFERFTDRARKAMQLANQEAQRLNHEYVGTEHVLLGIIKLNEGISKVMLNGCDAALRLKLESLIQPGPQCVAMGKLPQTPRVKSAIDMAMKWANENGFDYFGDEHLLLGLSLESEGVAAQALEAEGLAAGFLARRLRDMSAEQRKPVPLARETPRKKEVDIIITEFRCTPPETTPELQVMHIIERAVEMFLPHKGMSERNRVADWVSAKYGA